jgi:hypothetical protein
MRHFTKECWKLMSGFEIRIINKGKDIKNHLGKRPCRLALKWEILAELSDFWAWQLVNGVRGSTVTDW